MPLQELINLRYQLLVMAQEFESECPECQMELATAYFNYCTLGTIKVEQISDINSEPESN